MAAAFPQAVGAGRGGAGGAAGGCFGCFLRWEVEEGVALVCGVGAPDVDEMAELGVEE